MARRACKIERIQKGQDNCYLVSQGANAVLVDTGKMSMRDTLFSACESCDIKTIILTHGHFDHCQNAACMARELDVPIFMHEGDADLMRDNTVQVMQSDTFLGWVLRHKSAREFETEKIESFEVASFLKEGDTLRGMGIDATVIELPGHTMGSIGLLVGNDDLIVGDALINVPNARKAMIYVDEVARDDSARKIAALGSRKIWYGHGAPTENWLAG